MFGDTTCLCDFRLSLFLCVILSCWGWKPGPYTHQDRSRSLALCALSKHSSAAPQHHSPIVSRFPEAVSQSYQSPQLWASVSLIAPTCAPVQSRAPLEHPPSLPLPFPTHQQASQTDRGRRNNRQGHRTPPTARTTERKGQGGRGMGWEPDRQ